MSCRVRKATISHGFLHAKSCRVCFRLAAVHFHVLYHCFKRLWAPKIDRKGTSYKQLTYWITETSEFEEKCHMICSVSKRTLLILTLHSLNPHFYIFLFLSNKPLKPIWNNVFNIRVIYSPTKFRPSLHVCKKSNATDYAQ